MPGLLAPESGTGRKLLPPRETKTQKRAGVAPGTSPCSTAASIGLVLRAGMAFVRSLQVRSHPPGINEPLRLGTQPRLVILTLVFTSPGPVPSFAACQSWHCNMGMTHQDQRHLQVAVSRCIKKNLLYYFFFLGYTSALQNPFVLKTPFFSLRMEYGKKGKEMRGTSRQGSLQAEHRGC